MVYLVKFYEYNTIDANGEVSYSQPQYQRVFASVKMAYNFMYHLARLYRKYNREASLEILRMYVDKPNQSVITLDVIDAGLKRNVLWINRNRVVAVVE